MATFIAHNILPCMVAVQVGLLALTKPAQTRTSTFRVCTNQQEAMQLLASFPARYNIGPNSERLGSGAWGVEPGKAGCGPIQMLISIHVHMYNHNHNYSRKAKPQGPLGWMPMSAVLHLSPG